MRAQVTLKPGQRGTKRLVAKYGANLVYVRYRYDQAQKKRFKTVELIVETLDWEPPARQIEDAAAVGVFIGWKEAALQAQIKRAGGRWNPARRLWELRYDRVVALGLEDRIRLQ